MEFFLKAGDKQTEEEGGGLEGVRGKVLAVTKIGKEVVTVWRRGW